MCSEQPQHTVYSRGRCTLLREEDAATKCELPKVQNPWGGSHDGGESAGAEPTPCTAAVRKRNCHNCCDGARSSSEFLSLFPFHALPQLGA
ncbi:hypothetical protein MTO96_037632 [Rhipicephalus appendiculatus]